MTATLPAFVLCLANSDNKMCETGRVYSTLEPVGRYYSQTFWSKTLKLFKHEFREATLQEYLDQKEEPDTSFDEIEVQPMEPVFHQRVKPKKKKKKKKKDAFYNPSSPHYMKPVKAPAAKKTGTKYSNKVPHYLKYIEWNAYADFWMNLKKEDVGKTFNTQLDHKQNLNFETDLRIHPESYAVSDKLHWNLSRNHGTPPMAAPAATEFDWAKYHESIRVRAEQLKAQKV